MIAFSNTVDTIGVQQLSNNLRCVMARKEMTLSETAEKCGVDERTVRSLLKGRTRPHIHTLTKLAAGLGVDVAELVSANNPRFAFDRGTNTQLRDTVDRFPRLFDRWTPSEFEELCSRFGVGGEMTEEAILRIAQQMNERRDTIRHVMAILESDQAGLFRDIVSAFFKDVGMVAA